MNRENKRKTFEKGYYKTHACNDTFTCKVCGRVCTPQNAGSDHRNHCPNCLSSLHVDEEPGDRASDCGGIMEPVAVWVRKGGEWAIIHRCKRCGKLSSNRVAADDNPMKLMSIAMKPLCSPPFPLDYIEEMTGLDGRRWTDAVSRRRNYKMDYIRVTKENIDKEHICCAMSGKQSLAKKEWLKQRFEEGLVFYRSAERGKCFIEYITAENAWVPIEAAGWLYINCLWVSGSLKGHGYSSELLEECLRDAKAQGKNGVCILCAEGRKREFLADPKFLTHKGFKVSDVSDCGINLMYLPLAESAQPPRFKACAKHPKVEENGFVLYYTDQCPYTYYWVPKVQEIAKEHGIPFKAVHITEKETAQNVPAPVTTYALFRDGKFVTQSIQSDKKFLKLADVAD